MSEIAVYVAPTIAGTSYIVHIPGGSWFVPSCIGGWLLRRPYFKTTAGLKRLAKQDARWAMVVMGLAA